MHLDFARSFSCAALIFACASGVMGAELKVAYAFDPPRIDASDGSFSLVTVDGCEPFQKNGQPLVPFRTGRILLPPDAEVTQVSFELLAPEMPVVLAKPLNFGRTPIPIGESDHPAVARAALDEPDATTYASDDPYPSNRAQLVSVQKMNGCSVAIVRIFPVRYRPASGRLLFCPKISVRLVVEVPAMKRAAAFPHVLSAERRERVMDFVDNPEDVDASEIRALSTPLDLDAYDYLLVTTAALTNSFQPLVDQKLAEGLAVKVATMETILAESVGVDSAEKLRSYLSYAYANWGITYVLLGGDMGTVPHRQAYAYCQGADPTMPTDLYFACLDGSWNSDGDAYWGEPTDGEGGGEVDLLAEVYVGRAPVDTPTEAARFVEKTVRYAQGGHDNAEKALFMGEYMGNGIQGGDGLAKILPSFKDFTVAWLDDRPSASRTWSSADAMAALNTSPHLIAHYGHANTTYALGLDRQALASLTNGAPFLVNSMGCDSGAFDYSSGDCFAEELMKGNRAGAYAVIMNTRTGWYDNINDWMYSGEFVKAFFTRLLALGETRIGVAHQLSRQTLLGNVERSGNMTYRWCYFENTLFGDPHTALKPDAMAVQPTTGISATGYVGGPFAPASCTYAISNVGTGVLYWASSHASDWLSVVPESGCVPAGGTTNVVLRFNAFAGTLPSGAYFDQVVISNSASGFSQRLPVALSLFGNLSLGSSAYSVTEDEGAHALLTVVRTWNTNLTATVDFATTDGTALAGSDYVATNGTLTFAVGEATKSIPIEIVDDDMAESTETLRFTLSNPVGFATLETPFEAVLTIRDNDWLDHFAWSAAGPEQHVGRSFDMTASAINRTGGRFAGFSGFCQLYATRGNAFEYEIDGSTNRWDYPMASYKADARTQAIYTVEEVGAPGLITGLSLYVWKKPGQTLNAWTLRLKHTSLPHYDAATRRWDTNGWTVAFQTNATFSSIGWKKFAFSTPFAYNGTNNLLVDFSFNNSSAVAQSGECYAAIVSTNRSLFAKSDNGYGDPLLWNGTVPAGSIVDAVPGVRFEKCDLLPLMPSTTGAFVGGMWSGGLTLLEEATNVVLRLYDGVGHGGSSAPFELTWLSLAGWRSMYELPADGSGDDVDTDGDGLKNWDEWIAGTVPTNTASVLQVQEAFPVDAGSGMRVRWQSIVGKRYWVESCDSLSSPISFTPFASNVLGQATCTEILDTRPAPTGSRFYRIGVQQE